MGPSISTIPSCSRRLASFRASIRRAWSPQASTTKRSHASTLTQLGFVESQYGIAAPPSPDNGPRGAEAILNTQNVDWVSSQTKYPAQAWQFIQWMTDPTGFFAKNYLKDAFGTLSFADNK